MAASLSEKYARFEVLGREAEASEAELAAGQPQTQLEPVATHIDAEEGVLWSAAEQDTIRSLTLQPTAVWQVAVSRARAWMPAELDADDDGSGSDSEIELTDENAVRPYVLTIIDVYPAAQLINVHLSPEVRAPPKALHVLRWLLQAMTSPPTGRARQRPGRLAFTHMSMARQCGASLRACGIEPVMLSPPPALKQLVAGYSEKLIEQGMAAPTGAEGKPALQSAGASAEVLACFWTAAHAYAAAAPWKVLPDRLAVRVRVDRDVRVLPAGWAKAGSWWFAAVGWSALQDGAEEEEAPHGLCGFQHRWDAEQRLMSSVDEPGKPPAAALAHPLDQVCTKCGAEAKQRCARCRAVYYCSRACQQADWAAHSADGNCVAAPAARTPGRPAWGAFEAACLFDSALNCPWEDLEAMDEAGVPASTEAGVPVPMVFRQGRAARADAATLVWLMRGMEALITVAQSMRAAARSFLPSACWARVTPQAAMASAWKLPAGAAELTPVARPSRTIALTGKEEPVAVVAAAAGLDSEVDSMELLLDPMSTAGEREQVQRLQAAGQSDALGQELEHA